MKFVPLMTHRKGASAKVLGIVAARDWFGKEKLPMYLVGGWVVAVWHEYPNGEDVQVENLRTLAGIAHKEHAVKFYNTMVGEYENL